MAWLIILGGFGDIMAEGIIAWGEKSGQAEQSSVAWQVETLVFFLVVSSFLSCKDVFDQSCPS
jgi:hypothetical protein